MSVMMPPDPSAAPNLPVPPGGGDGGPPAPMDALNAAQGPIPGGGDGQGGMAGLLAALGGGGDGGAGPAGPDQGGPTPDEAGMDPVEHIQQAMKHLMMALAKEPNEQTGQGVIKGMGALQGILAGEEKKNAQLSQLGG